MSLGKGAPILSTIALAWEFGRRDLKARRRFSAVMLLRSLVQPLAQTGLFWLLISGILRLRFDNTPGGYPVFLLAGLAAWGFLSSVVLAATSCLANNAGLVRRVAFPREALVYSLAAEGFVQSGIVSLVLVLVVALSPALPGPGASVLWLPLLAVVLVLFSLGVALLAAALSVLLPSTGLAAPILLQAWFFATPIVYPPARAPDWLAATFDWNPMAVIAEAVRRVLLEDAAPDPWSLVYAAGVAAVVFAVGRFVFRRCDHLLPDLV